MSRLIYSMIMSLDGYVADDAGDFDWAAPDEQVHAFVNELERPVGTYLFGRRMYETMLVWESPEFSLGQPAVIEDYARIWQAADKVVYSTTLNAASTARTRVEKTFDPGAIRDMKQRADRDISIGGPTLAAQAIRAGLIDEYQIFVVPVVVGGGLPAFPEHRLDLKLLDERRFDNGTLYTRYAGE